MVALITSEMIVCNWLHGLAVSNFLLSMHVHDLTSRQPCKAYSIPNGIIVNMIVIFYSLPNFKPNMFLNSYV